MSAAEIKADVIKWWEDTPAAGISLQIIDFIDRLPYEEREMMTYATFLTALHKDVIDADFMAAINILTNSRVNALDMHGLFVDYDETEHEIDREELVEARRSGKFVHPDTGELIDNFDERIIPFFTPSSRFDAQCGNSVQSL